MALKYQQPDSAVYWKIHDAVHGDEVEDGFVIASFKAVVSSLFLASLGKNSIITF